MEPHPNKPTAGSSPAKPATVNPSSLAKVATANPSSPTKSPLAKTSVVNERMTASAPPMEDDAQLSGSKHKTMDGSKQDDAEEEVQVVGEKKEGDKKGQAAKSSPKKY